LLQTSRNILVTQASHQVNFFLIGTLFHLRAKLLIPELLHSSPTTRFVIQKMLVLVKPCTIGRVWRDMKLAWPARHGTQRIRNAAVADDNFDPSFMQFSSHG